MSKPYFTKQQQETIHKRAKFRCEYCQILEAYVEGFVFEHIRPLSLGGVSDLDNIANACNLCNGHKYNKIEGFDSVTGQTIQLFNPRTDNWKDHFTWNEDYTGILGITPIGRVTVETLKMNRLKLLNLRKLLILANEHPPEDLI